VVKASGIRNRGVPPNEGLIRSAVASRITLPQRVLSSVKESLVVHENASGVDESTRAEGQDDGMTVLREILRFISRTFG